VARAALGWLPEAKPIVLPAGNRLRRRQDFATAVRRGRRAGCPMLVAHVAHESVGDRTHAGPVDSTSSAPRVGFVVSRAVGSAVVRNAVKRRLRHLMHDRLDRLAPGTLVVIRALPPAAGASYAELAADLDASLDRAIRAPAVNPRATEGPTS